MARQCRGCGAKIQTKEPKEYGYVPPHLLTEEEEVICQRCFRISHYSQDEIGPVLKDASWRAISAGVEWADQVLLIVDIFDFEAGFPQDLLQLITSKDVVVVANKADLLPKQTPPDEVKTWAKARLQKIGIFSEVFVVSALNGYGFPELATWIEKHT